MTITKDAEWGKELGGIFYSSYVGNVFRDPVNGNMLINSGGAMVDGNGIPTELDSGTGPLDLDVDPYTSESRPIFVEVQQNEDGSYTKLFELVATSGRVKTPDDGEGNTWRIDMSNFFVIKKDLYE
ncbi:MAG: aryl-sulfate sulfotransferase, partial [Shewanella sp.]|nr:aryl-sulfate sulfotransferase [Shewanella sp.]